MRCTRLLLVAAIVLASCDSEPEIDGGTLPADDSGAEPPARVTLASLYERLVDPVRLTHMPAPFHRTYQASSYDRESVTPGNDEWFANRDFAHFIRTEERDGRTEHVMLDTVGPGAIVRVWSTAQTYGEPRGTIRMYLDDELVLEEDAERFLMGQIEPWTDPFVYEAMARGSNLYLPIPYTGRIVVTIDQTTIYYHFNTIRFADGTDVEPFSRQAYADAADTIARVASILEDPGVLDDELTGLPETAVDLSAASPSLSLTADAAGSMIRRIELRPSDTSAEALRSTLLVMTFDGMETVRVPLGDFFGGGPGIAEHVSLITEASTDGTLIARWAMPFESTATIAIEAQMDVRVTGRVHVEPRAEGAPPMLYFNAGWRQNGGRSSRPFYDWTIADLRGQGQYVGTILNVTNPRMIWWGEGDEKIFVDGETFPGYFGTGTEDYFGYAHTDTGYFARPFHGQPVTPQGPGNYGRTSNYRYHLLDPIPFREGLRFDQEVWHWEEADFPLDAISIWYATAETTDDDVPPMPDELIIPPLP